MRILYAFFNLFVICGVLLVINLIYNNSNQTDGYVLAVCLVIIPRLIIYGIKNGYASYEDDYDFEEKRQESVVFDDVGMAFIQPILDITYFIEWKTVKEVVFRMDEDYNEYIFYLTQKPKLTFHENPWFINKILPRFFNPKEISITSKCKNFNEIPVMKAKHLTHLTL
jgi:hypothetical protein